MSSSYQPDAAARTADPTPTPSHSRPAASDGPDRAPETASSSGGLPLTSEIETETSRISADVTGQALACREAARRRQAQLAVPPPLPPAALPEPPAAPPEFDETTTWDFAGQRLAETLDFTRILVPLDGSERAERAIPVAARIARASRGSVLLVQGVTPPTTGVAGYVPSEGIAQTAVDAASAYLKRVAGRDEFADLEVHRKPLHGVSVATTLLEAIDLYQCDLVVLCSHGRSGLTRWALGSVAAKLVRHAAAPVLVLRPDGPPPRSAEPGADPAVRALVPLDGSALAESALQPAARLVAALAVPDRGAIHLLRVLDHPPAASEQSVLPYRNPDEAALEAARTYLATISQRFVEGELASLRLRISTSVRADLDPACAILDEAEGGDTSDPATTARPYDVIAMATHGRSGLALWALGSVTDRVLQSTSAPLLVVPPGEAGAEVTRQGDS